MAVKTLLLLIAFAFCSVGTLFVPMIGVVGYVLHYHFWPDNQWWGRDVSEWGLRFAFTIGLCLLIGIVLNKHKLKLSRPFMRFHDWLLVAVLLAAVLSSLTGFDLAFYPDDRAHQTMLIDKLSKVLLFCLLMSHVVTTPRRVDVFFWTVMVGTLYTGYQAWDAPLWKFLHARLDGIGGPDFRESSYLGAHFAMVLPIIGVQFLRGGLRAKLFCAVTGGFAVNGLILTRTRAAFIAVCVGLVVALLLSLRGRRLRLLLYLLPGLIVAGYLTDAGFRERMKTIEVEPDQERDSAAAGRLEAWKAAKLIFRDHPMGIGVGCFRVIVSRYSDTLRRRDVHSTYLRCATELGFPGIGLLGLLIISAAASLYRARRWTYRCPYGLQIRYYIYGLAVSLTMMLTAGIFMTQLYIEEFWWMLTLPICLLRAAEFEYVRTRPALGEATESEGKAFGEAGWTCRPAPPLGNTGLT